MTDQVRGFEDAHSGDVLTGDAQDGRAPVYFPPPAPDLAAMEAKHGLAETIRALAEACVCVDSSGAGVAALAAVQRLLDVARQRMEVLPGLVIDRSAGIAELSLAERSPFVGKSNPLAAPLHLEFDGVTTRGWAVYGHAYEGGPGDMHGGAVVAAFDDLLGCAQMVGPVAGRTGTLTVRFRARSPIGKQIDYEGRLDRVDGRKSYCSGEARCDGVLLAEAEAVFVAPRPTSGAEREAPHPDDADHG